MQKMVCIVLTLLFCLSACGGVMPIDSGGTTKSTTATGHLTENTTIVPKTTRSLPTTRSHPQEEKTIVYSTAERYREIISGLRTLEDIKRVFTTESGSWDKVSSEDMSMLLKDKFFLVPIGGDDRQDIGQISFSSKGYSRFNLSTQNICHMRVCIEHFTSSGDAYPARHYDKSSFVAKTGIQITKYVAKTGNHVGYVMEVVDNYTVSVYPGRCYCEENCIEDGINQLTFEKVEIK